MWEYHSASMRVYNIAFANIKVMSLKTWNMKSEGALLPEENSGQMRVITSCHFVEDINSQLQ